MLSMRSLCLSYSSRKKYRPALQPLVQRRLRLSQPPWQLLQRQQLPPPPPLGCQDRIQCWQPWPPSKATWLTPVASLEAISLSSPYLNPMVSKRVGALFSFTKFSTNRDVNIHALIVSDEFNNNDKESLDILKLLKSHGINTQGIDDSSSQISRSLPRQDTSDTSVDLNIFNDEMRLRNNIENMYKKGKSKHFTYRLKISWKSRLDAFV